MSYAFCGQRYYGLHSLIFAVKRGDRVDIKQKLNCYSSITESWNQKFTNHMVRITINISWDLALQLEREINDKFVEISSKVQQIAEIQDISQAHRKDLDKLLGQLNRLNHKIFLHNRDLYKIIYAKRNEKFSLEGESKKVKYLDDNSRQLFKNLFVRRI